MKNIFKIIALVIVTCIATSCKTHEKCPAFGKYGKVEVIKAIRSQQANS